MVRACGRPADGASARGADGPGAAGPRGGTVATGPLGRDGAAGVGLDALGAAGVPVDFATVNFGLVLREPVGRAPVDFSTPVSGFTTVLPGFLADAVGPAVVLGPGPALGRGPGPLDGADGAVVFAAEPFRYSKAALTFCIASDEPPISG